MNHRTTTLAALLALGVALSGCGGSDSDSKSGESEQDEGARTPCKADATTKPTGLPAAFPVPGELTFTAVQKDGPTNVVDGYWSAGLDEAYSEYVDQVKQAGYKVLFSEKEEHDAEISY